MPLSLPALYAFIGGRGAQEKTIAELKGEFTLDVVPTRYSAPTVPGSNSASSPTTSPGASSSTPSPRPTGAKGHPM
jgi:hypothetical protein